MNHKRIFVLRIVVGVCAALILTSLYFWHRLSGGVQEAAAIVTPLIYLTFLVCLVLYVREGRGARSGS